MQLVQVAAERAGDWMGNNFYKGSKLNCKALHWSTVEYFQYPVIRDTHKHCHHSLIWTTKLNLYAKKQGFAVDVDG